MTRTTEAETTLAHDGAALPRPDSFRPRNGPPGRSRRARWRAVALIAVHVAVLIHLAHWKITGTTVTPVEPSEAMETLELGYVNAGFLLFCGTILLTMVLGRFFCGWACHVVAYQDLCAWLLARIGLRPRPVRSRLLVFVPLGAAFYMFAWPTVHRWLAGGAAPELSLRLTTDAFWRTFPGPWIALLTVVVCGFLIVYWLGAKGFCTYGCPYGAVFGLAERLAPARIRVTDACEGCGHCTATCTSNVRVHEEVARYRMVVDPGCMKCMDCISVCPKHALYLGFGRPSLLRARRRRRPRADFSWGEELALAAVFVAALLAFRALYALVPFLLALGLAVLTAIFAVTAWRLLRRPELRFQSRALKAHGRLTAAGRWAAVGLVLWLAFAGHSLFVQYEHWSGERLAHVGGDGAQPASVRAEALAGSLAHLERAERFGLVADPRVQQLFGLVLRERGELSGAEQRLRRALALQPSWPAAAIPLADLLAVRGAWPEAEAILRALLADDPQLAPARERLRRLEQRRGG